jgi:hypothetical protein
MTELGIDVMFTFFQLRNKANLPFKAIKVPRVFGPAQTVATVDGIGSDLPVVKGIEVFFLAHPIPISLLRSESVWQILG